MGHVGREFSMTAIFQVPHQYPGLWRQTADGWVCRCQNAGNVKTLATTLNVQYSYTFAMRWAVYCTCSYVQNITDVHISSINAVMCRLAHSLKAELQWPVCSPDMVYGVWGRGGAWGKMSACGVHGVKVPQREGGMVMWKQAGVINLGAAECLCHVSLYAGVFRATPPHPPQPGPVGPSFILIYELPALLYYLCIDPSRSTRN